MNSFDSIDIDSLVDNLAKLENLSKNRKKCKIFSYNSGEIVHKKQLLFHKCLKRNRWVFGGNRSGKTECGAVESLWLARGIHPFRPNKKNVSGWVVSLSSRVQREVTQKKILEYLPKSWISDIVMSEGRKTSPEAGIVDSIFIKNVFGGISRISFKSCEEGRDKFQGASLDFVWFDEEPPEDIYTECLMRVMDRAGDIFGTMTPLLGLTFVYDKIYVNELADPEIFCLFMEWADNPFLPLNEIQRLQNTLNPDQLDARRFGKFSDIESGLVYKEFDMSVHVIEPFSVPSEWFDSISIDPGLNNPLACHFYAVDFDGNVFVIAEHFDSGKNVDYHASKIIDIAKRLNWPLGRSGKLEALIDSAASQKTLASSRSVVDLFFDCDILVNPHVNKDLFSGISRVKNYLKDEDGHAHLFIFSSCINLIREFKTYFWGDGDRPIKKDDHCLDELRYYVMSKPEPSRVVSRKSIIQKDKERLIRKARMRRGF